MLCCFLNIIVLGCVFLILSDVFFYASLVLKMWHIFFFSYALGVFVVAYFSVFSWLRACIFFRREGKMLFFVL